MHGTLLAFKRALDWLRGELDPAARDALAYRRLQVPICWRRGRVLGSHRPHHDLSLGGLKFYSDEPPPLGARLELDLLPPGETPLTCWVRVAWVQALEPERNARFEFGAYLLKLSGPTEERLRALLEEHV